MNKERTYLKILYALWAPMYDRLIDRIFSFDRKSILDKLNLHAHARVLEIGVGTGLNLSHYPRDCEVIGVDFSAAMLKEARKKSSKAQVRLVIADAQALEFPDSYFSHSLATFVIRVAPSPRQVLKELSRVIKAKGILVIVDQFQECNFLTPFKLLLGWGNDFSIEHLLTDSSWQIITQEKLTRTLRSTILVLENNKH